MPRSKLPHKTLPFFRPRIGLRDVNAVLKTLSKGALTQGPAITEFERKLEEKLDVPHVVSCNSGTSALILSLRALGIGPGDEVIVPNYTFVATANAVLLVGARPVLVDVEPDYFCIDPDLLEAAITPDTRAVIGVHLFGQPADLDRLQKICRSRGLYLIEDAAQSLGAKFEGRHVGSFGDSSALSFFPSKNITTGEGGASTFQSEEHAIRASMLRSQGQSSTYNFEEPGFNFRLDSLSAALGTTQLSRLDKFVQERRSRAALYDTHLPNNLLPARREASFHSFNQYVIKVPLQKRDSLINELAKVGIATKVYYPNSLEEVPFLQDSRRVTNGTGVSLSSTLLALPILPPIGLHRFKTLAVTVGRVAREVLA